MSAVLLQRVVLVDDSEADNFLHRLSLEETGLVENIQIFLYAEDALVYLQRMEPGAVNLILLDINMPRMNGFEFLEAYQDLGLDPSSIVIIMLTTSTNPDDEERARRYHIVKDFLNKPLTAQGFRKLVAAHFA